MVEGRFQPVFERASLHLGDTGAVVRDPHLDAVALEDRYGHVDDGIAVDVPDSVGDEFLEGEAEPVVGPGPGLVREIRTDARIRVAVACLIDDSGGERGDVSRSPPFLDLSIVGPVTWLLI